MTANVCFRFGEATHVYKKTTLFTQDHSRLRPTGISKIFIATFSCVVGQVDQTHGQNDGIHHGRREIEERKVLDSRQQWQVINVQGKNNSIRTNGQHNE